MKAQPVQVRRLTRKYFQGLLDGVFLVTNFGSTRAVPLFAEHVAPKKARQSQWKLLKELKANNAVCLVFKSKEDYERYRKQQAIPVEEYGTGLTE